MKRLIITTALLTVIAFSVPNGQVSGKGGGGVVKSNPHKSR